MTINEWADRWNVPVQAMIELATVHYNAVVPSTSSQQGKSESYAQQAIRLEAPKHDTRLFRNNVGACSDENGNHIRYGLANESAAMNKKIKSHDLIGITSVVIQPHHVGQLMGIFTSIEVKRPGWTYKDTAHERAQKQWGEIVVNMGGIAQFATGPGDIWQG